MGAVVYFCMRIFSAFIILIICLQSWALAGDKINELFRKDADTRFLEVFLRSGRRDILHRGDLCSGAIVASIVQRSKERVIKRAIASGKIEIGITREDLHHAVNDEFRENEVFPPSDSVEDWLKLLDYEPENVVKVMPIHPQTEKETSPIPGRVV